jgi:2-hydroxychromene-2-carboxylate isomerase
MKVNKRRGVALQITRLIPTKIRTVKRMIILVLQMRIGMFIEALLKTAFLRMKTTINKP